MATMAATTTTTKTPEIVLYHYSYSPYARRIVWYLALRGIPYKQCLQPGMLPRPDVARLGVAYRRIPILTIGRDVYLDSRLQLLKLEELAHPSPRLGAATAAGRATEQLLARFVMDGGVFRAGVTLLPTDLPMLRDPKYYADRSDYLGSALSAEGMRRAAPEAEVELGAAFSLLEDGLLADGRTWVLDTPGPGLADIEAVWAVHWLSGIPGALRAERFSAERFPRTYAWIGRFQAAVSAAKRAGPRPAEVSGEQAAALVEGAGWHEEEEGLEFDAADPVARAQGLARGDAVVVWPTDTGSAHRERGRLVGLDGREVVVEVATATGQAVRVHAPRHGFRVKKAGAAAAL